MTFWIIVIALVGVGKLLQVGPSEHISPRLAKLPGGRLVMYRGGRTSFGDTWVSKVYDVHTGVALGWRARLSVLKMLMNLHEIQAQQERVEEAQKLLSDEVKKLTS